MEQKTREKYDGLLASIRTLGSLVVAFSGGVDSTFLLYAAREAVGEKVLAVTARSSTFPEREMQEALSFCESQGIRHCFLDSEELDIPGFRENPKNRCYYCKKELFTKIKQLAAEQGYAYVAEGSNQDDLGDYRPGMEAVKELGIVSPLLEAGLTKQEIRDLSKAADLPTWDKPSFACLASRFVYGEEITKKKLEKVERAEQLLLDLGFRQMRVRMHGEDLARIEVPEEEIARLTEPELRKQVTKQFRTIGFSYVCVDLQGYRTGSMNESL